MPIDSQCVACFERSYYNLLKKQDLSVAQHDEFQFYFYNVMAKSQTLTSPEIQQMLHRKLKEVSGIEDFYLNEKRESNRLALRLYQKWRTKIQESKHAFNLALRLAIAGNIMDYGARSSFNLEQTIERVLLAKLAIDHSEYLKERIAEAQNVLYLGDNAGEIVFDRLFIETINHPNLVYVVRGGSVLNDATLDDAAEVGMDTAARVISNGFDAPSTVVHRSSKQFQQHFNEADLIISKGQGNLEGLLPLNDKRIFFVLMAKCDVIANLLGVQRDSFIVYNSACI